MNTDDQQAIWTQRTVQATTATVLAGYRSPHQFQAEFVPYLNALGASQKAPARLKVCELGCEFGVTTLLLSGETFDRHALDLNPQPLTLMEEAARQLGQTVQVHPRDMFHTGWPDGEFDVVFSNGVLEHYDVSQRTEALRECARITRPGGKVIVGVPNHCSPPYRFAYLLRRALGKWHYPPEEKIPDLAAELSAVPTLRHEQTHFFDQETVFAILPYPRVLSLPFRLWHRLLPVQPYLRVFQLARLAS